MASNHFCLPFGWSSDTPMIVKFLSLNLLKAFTTFGFSLRHGPHHDAQKSTKTYLPRNDSKLTVLPAVSASAKTGAISPNATAFNFGNLSPISLPPSDCFISGDKVSYNGFTS